MAALRALLPLLLSWLLGQYCLAAEVTLPGARQLAASSNPVAREHFLAGVSYLHSAGLKQARAEFATARELDPGFVLAYWGEALALIYPLHPDHDPGEATRVLASLGSSPELRLARARTALERGFLASVEALIQSGNTPLERRQAYRQTMERLYQAYPAQEEVLAFTALALLSEAAWSDPHRAQEIRRQARELAGSLFTANEQHAGAAHYLIHSTEQAADAVTVLNAAERFIETAADVSHARHLAARIHGYLGHWYEAAELNETAFYAARAIWEPGDDPVDQLHALDFGQYADLQLADYDAAQQWIERAEDTLLQNPHNEQAAELLAKLHARLIVEGRDWRITPLSSTMTADELLAAGISAVNRRDLALAREASRLLDERATRHPDEVPLQISHLEVQASILFMSGQTVQGRQAIDTAVSLSANQATDRSLPDPIKPASELKGELLLRVGEFEQAIAAFREALTVTPYRPWSILGLARSHMAAGDPQQAGVYYRELLKLWDDAALLGVSEARTHLRLYD